MRFRLDFFPAFFQLFTISQIELGEVDRPGNSNTLVNIRHKVKTRLTDASKSLIGIDTNMITPKKTQYKQLYFPN